MISNSWQHVCSRRPNNCPTARVTWLFMFVLRRILEHTAIIIISYKVWRRKKIKIIISFCPFEKYTTFLSLNPGFESLMFGANGGKKNSGKVCPPLPGWRRHHWLGQDALEKKDKTKTKQTNINSINKDNNDQSDIMLILLTFTSYI